MSGGVPVELELPVDRSFDPVGRQLVAGMGARIGLTFDQTEDVQRALEAVFAQPPARRTRTVTLAPSDDGWLVSAGPVTGGPNERRGLERVLSTLVDEVRLEERDRALWISMRLTASR